MGARSRGDVTGAYEASVLWTDICIWCVLLVPLFQRRVISDVSFDVASQTLGEEYVEILPYAVKRSNFPSRIVSVVTSPQR